MITTFRKRQPPQVESNRPRTYFVSIPKTAGIPCKTCRKNNYARGDALVDAQTEAPQLPADASTLDALGRGAWSP